MYPHASVAYNDSKATYTEGETLARVNQRTLVELGKSHKVKPTALTSVETAGVGAGVGQ